VSNLTPQQNVAMLHVCAGRTTKEIGALMGISEHTAKFHVDAAIHRLGATTRTLAAVRFTLANLEWVRSSLEATTPGEAP
jgi:two-component system, NarL family, nitrate/nitrite response regulator NarL